MTLQVTPTGLLEGTKSSPQVGDIIPAHGRIMKIETISVTDFVMYALSGGIPLHGFDEIMIDEKFVTSANEDGEEVIEGITESSIENASIVAEDDEEGAEVIGEDVEDGGEDDGLPSIIGGEVVVYWVNQL